MHKDSEAKKEKTNSELRKLLTRELVKARGHICERPATLILNYNPLNTSAYSREIYIDNKWISTEYSSDFLNIVYKIKCLLSGHNDIFADFSDKIDRLDTSYLQGASASDVVE